jgi:hypothetical protein
VLIAVIGKHWLISTDEKRRRRLGNPNDFVRLEIATALKRNIRVIPVLVDGASMPPSGQLPEDLKPLALRNALNVSHERFRADAERLIGGVGRALESARVEQQRKREEQERLAAEQRERGEKERLETERREAERNARLEAERRRREEQDRLETEQRQREDKERLAPERREAELKERLEAPRQKEERERLETEQREKERLEAEQRERNTRTLNDVSGFAVS